MKASLHNYRQSPRKVRLLADLVRGKSATAALRILGIAPKRAALTMAKLINSAVSNARNTGQENPEDLRIEMVQVNKGVTLKRMMPRARGSSSKINKRSSNVTLTLGVMPLKKGRASKGAARHDSAESKSTVTKTAVTSKTPTKKCTSLHAFSRSVKN